MKTYQSFRKCVSGTLLLIASLGALSSVKAQEFAPVSAEHDRAASASRPFTGYLEIRQKGGSQSYGIHVTRGKVTSGIGFHKGTDVVDSDIVGGWYDRHHLMLLIQSRAPDLHDQWAAHAHQFRQTGDGFILEHSLYGYGKTADSGEVYRPHVIETIVEVETGHSAPLRRHYREGAEAQAVVDRLETLDRNIALEKEHLLNAQKQADSASELRKQLADDFERRSMRSAGSEGEMDMIKAELRDLARKVREADTRFANARKDLRTHSERLERLQAERAQLMQRKDEAAKKIEDAR